MSGAPRDPVQDGAATAHREKRSRAVMKGASSGVASRVVSVTCTLLQVPLALDYLGIDGFGLWMIFASVSTLLTMGDFGMSLSAKTMLSAAFGRDQPGEMRAVARAAERDLLVGSAITTALALTLAWIPKWDHFIVTGSADLQSQIPWAATALAVTAGATILTSIGPALAAAAQLTWALNLASALGGILTLAVVVVSARLNLSWTTFVTIALALPALANFGLYLTARRSLGWNGKSQEHLPVSQVGEMRRQARWFLVPHAGSLFMQSGIQITLAATGGTSAAAAYNIAQRILGLIGQIHWMAISPLWPAYAEAQARGDYTWMRAAYRKSFLVTLGVFLPGMALAAAIMPGIAELWTGHPIADLTPALVGAATLWFSLQLTGQPPAVLLNGIGRIRSVARFGTLGHGVSLVGMTVAGLTAGAPGVIVGMTVGYAMVGLPVTLIEATRAIRHWPR